MSSVLVMKVASAATELNKFIARFSPEIAAQAKATLGKMRDRLPGAVEMVYDNYNALVVGFCPVERASEVIMSIAIYPRWINLCFFAGDRLPDPQKLLRGNGKIVRTIRLEDAKTLDEPAVKALMKAALENASRPLDRKQSGRIVIASVSAKRRPRRVGARD
ncbi:MAG: DUF1801 domain-containing protein [Candidatus Korobacteraceae bacterium]